jgi:hypothetical protein
MKVLTVKNPWAYLIIFYGKDIENRTRKLNYRGRIAIHAAKESDAGAYLLEPDDPVMQTAFEAARERRAEIENTNGKIIGTVEMYDCTPRPELPDLPPRLAYSPWAEPLSPWHYWLKDPVSLAVPIAARGMLGLWEYREL